MRESGFNGEGIRNSSSSSKGARGEAAVSTTGVGDAHATWGLRFGLFLSDADRCLQGRNGHVGAERNGECPINHRREPKGVIDECCGVVEPPFSLLLAIDKNIYYNIYTHILYNIYI